jgi:metal-responsive CopG/Arc/MetJ family transcriptional regulator
MKNESYADKLKKNLRIAAYPNNSLLDRLDKWCKEEGRDRNEGICHIIRVMLDVSEGDDAELNTTLAMLEAQISRIKSVSVA